MIEIAFYLLMLVAPAPPQGAAERAFEDGQRHYQRGEYAEAIASFSEAYRLFPAPILVFDLAQAHRQAGNCRSALAEYRRFLQLAPGGPDAELAASHARALEQRCPPPIAAPAEVRREPPLFVKAKPETTRIQLSAPTRWIRFAALTAGLAAGAAAVLIELRTRDDLAHWKAEDQALRLTPAGDQPALDAWVQRQQANDRLAGSIARGQRTSLGLAAVGAVGLVGGTVLSFPSLFRW
jgi:tetratricopeptide (TPR) repeat protein